MDSSVQDPNACFSISGGAKVCVNLHHGEERFVTLLPVSAPWYSGAIAITEGGKAFTVETQVTEDSWTLAELLFRKPPGRKQMVYLRRLTSRHGQWHYADCAGPLTRN
jgi:hypothetical protein